MVNRFNLNNFNNEGNNDDGNKPPKKRGRKPKAFTQSNTTTKLDKAEYVEATRELLKDKTDLQYIAQRTLLRASYILGTGQDEDVGNMLVWESAVMMSVVHHMEKLEALNEKS